MFCQIYFKIITQILLDVLLDFYGNHGSLMPQNKYGVDVKCHKKNSFFHQVFPHVSADYSAY